MDKGEVETIIVCFLGLDVEGHGCPEVVGVGVRGHESALKLRKGLAEYRSDNDESDQK